MLYLCVWGISMCTHSPPPPPIHCSTRVSPPPLFPSKTPTPLRSVPICSSLCSPTTCFAYSSCLLNNARVSSRWCSQLLHNYLGNYAKEERKEPVQRDEDLGRGGLATMLVAGAQDGERSRLWSDSARESAAIKDNVPPSPARYMRSHTNKHHFEHSVSSQDILTLMCMWLFCAHKPAVFVLDNNSAVFVFFSVWLASTPVTIRWEALKEGGKQNNSEE